MAQTPQNQESVWSVDESPSIKSYTLANLRKLPQIENFSEEEIFDIDYEWQFNMAESLYGY